MSLRALPAKLGPDFILGVLLIALLMAPKLVGAEVLAEPEPPAPFNGSFKELSLRGGAALFSNTDRAGWTVDAGFRNSFPFYLGDNRFSYRYTRGQISEDLLQIHGFHAAFAVHPLYLALLSKGLISHLLSSLHVEFGVGVEYGLLRNEGQDEGALGLMGSLGAGFDLPLTEANNGRALWLNAVYRRTWSTLKMGGDDQGRLHDHGIFLGLGWRINGPLW